jgi:predicted DNA-binding protein with PD1-like motif
VSVSDGEGRTLGGHLAAGSIVRTTAEIVVVELRGLRFSRRRDAATAFRELVVRKARRSVAI